MAIMNRHSSYRPSSSSAPDSLPLCSSYHLSPITLRPRLRRTPAQFLRLDARSFHSLGRKTSSSSLVSMSPVIHRANDRPSSLGVSTYHLFSSGFTSIELIMVILCLGILTFAVGVKTFNKTEMGSAVAADQLIADLRYVQLLATSIGRPYQIVFNGNAYTMSRTDNMEVETKTLPDGQAVSTDFGSILMFNTLGEPYNSISAFPSPYGQIQLSGGDLVKVYNITGKANKLTDE